MLKSQTAQTIDLNGIQKGKRVFSIADSILLHFFLESSSINTVPNITGVSTVFK